MYYSARVPEIKKVRHNDIFEFMERPDKIVVDGRVFTVSRLIEMEGSTYMSYYECYQ